MYVCIYIYIYAYISLVRISEFDNAKCVQLGIVTSNQHPSQWCMSMDIEVINEIIVHNICIYIYNRIVHIIYDIIICIT